MSDENKIDPAKSKIYAEIGERIQAGVAMELKYDPQSASPKHLGVGNNMRAIDHAALAVLLIEKGVITWPEYQDALITAGYQEVRRIEAALTEKMGVRVKLGSQSEARANSKEIQHAILSTGETVPAAELICPVCKTMDINTHYNPLSREYECPLHHKWERSKESLRVQ